MSLMLSSWVTLVCFYSFIELIVYMSFFFPNYKAYSLGELFMSDFLI